MGRFDAIHERFDMNLHHLGLCVVLQDERGNCLGFGGDQCAGLTYVAPTPMNTTGTASRLASRGRHRTFASNTIERYTRKPKTAVRFSTWPLGKPPECNSLTT